MAKRRPVWCLSNRTVLIVRPKKPFEAWCESLPEIPEEAKTLIKAMVAALPAELRSEPQEPGPPAPDLYLVEPHDFPDVEEYMRLHWREILETELFGWSEDPSTWPKKRTQEMFGDWFDVEVLDTMLFDLVAEPIKRRVELE